MVVISVVGFGIFRGLQIRRSRNIEGVRRRDTMNIELDSLNSPSRDHSVISELDRMTSRPETRENIEDDHVIQNFQEIELDSSHTTDHANVEIGCEIGCIPGIDMIMMSIQKYMKNTMISLLILTFLLPWYLLLLYAFITNSGCENPTIEFIAELSEYDWFILTILLPLLIKLKLDRLSE